MNTDWITPQQLAALRVPGVPGTDRGVRLWLEKNLVVSRTKVRGKGYEIHIPSLPVDVMERVLAQLMLCGSPAGTGLINDCGAAGRPLGVTDEQRDEKEPHPRRSTVVPMRSADDTRHALPNASGLAADDTGRRSRRVPAALGRAKSSDRAAATDHAGPGRAKSSASATALTTAGAAADAARDDLWAWLASRPESIQAEARRRAAICMNVRALLDAGMRKCTAIAQVAAAEAVPAATLQRWWYGDARLPGIDRANPGDYTPLLAPRYAGRETMAEISPEAWHYLKADYLRPEQPSVVACYRRAQQAGRDKGWVLPSLKTVARRLDALPWQVTTLAREGKDALLRKLPHVTRTRAHLAPLEAVNADGHVFDVMVRLPTGETGRPVLVAWQDLYSGKVLAWRVGMSLNQHLVRLSFGDLVEGYGVPTHAYLDNGREFANKWLTGGSNFRYRFSIREDDPIGLFGLLGVTAHWTTPYHGQSKPIERAFRDLCEGIARHPACSGAYTGSNPTDKPDNYGTRVLDWNEFVAVTKAGINEHNTRPGRRTETARGRSFDSTFTEAFGRTVVRRPTAEQRRYWLLAAEGVKVRQTGHVAVEQNLYWCDALPGYIGQRVVVRFDPDHLDRPVAVYTLAGELIGDAERTVAKFDDRETSQTHNRANKRRLKAARDLRDAELQMTAAEAAAQLPALCDAPELPNPAAVRLMPVPRKARAESEPDDMKATGTDDYVMAADAIVRDWLAPRERLRLVDD